MTEPSTTERDQIEKLADSFMASYRAGQRPSIDAYVQQYPELANDLRGLIAALIVLERNAPRRVRQEIPSTERPTHGTAPREIGEFTIIREIGRGGMGVVYEAVQQSLGRHVALKVLSMAGLLNPTHLERFRLEARSAGRLHHSHIVPVFGVGEHEGTHYYAMQFIPGQSLDQVIGALARLRPGGAADPNSVLLGDEWTDSIVGGLRSGRFGADPAKDCDGPVADETPAVAARASTSSNLAAAGQFSSGSSGRPFYESVARVGLQVAEALSYAHTEGILHRDIKPSNLLLDGKGNTWVTDFGLVKADETQALTETGDFVGTLRYMAPERLNGWSDRRSDIYGLGATLYELLTLHPFFGKVDRAQLIDCIRNREPEAPKKIDPAVPRDLETILLKALAKEPGNRYHTADEMAEDLRRFLADRPILSRRATSRERVVRWCRRNPAMASLTTVAVLALVAGTVASTWQAVRATRAENLAEDRLHTEVEARQVADDARLAEAKQRQAAEAERSEAEKQRSAAEANYRKAKEAVDKYFTLVSDSKLLDVPGLQPLRKELLEAAAEFYKGASKERLSDPAILVDLAAAQSRLAQIYIASDQIDEAVTAIADAVTIVERVRRDFPGAVAHFPKLAGTYRGYRWSQGTLKAPSNPLAAANAIYRWEAILSKLAEQFPAEPKFQRDLLGVRCFMANALHKSQHANAVKFARQAHAAAEKLVQQDPNSPEYREDLAMTSHYLAIYVGGAEAPMLLRQSIKTSESLVSEFPELAMPRAWLGRALVELGLTTQGSDPQHAESALRRGVELNEALMRDFPNESAFREFLPEAIHWWIMSPATDVSDSRARELMEWASTELENKLKQQNGSRYPMRWLAEMWLSVAEKALKADKVGNEEEPHLRRASELYLQLYEQDHTYVYGLEQAGLCYRCLAEIAQRAGRLDETRTQYRAAKEVYRRVLKTGHTSGGADVFGSAFGWADSMANSVHDAESKHFVDGIVEVLNEHIRDRPQDLSWRSRLAALSHRLAERAVREEHDLAAAEKHWQRGLELFTELADKPSAEPVIMEHVGWCQLGLGDIARRTNRPDEARSAYRAAAAAWASQAANKNVPQRDGWYEGCQVYALNKLTSVSGGSPDDNESLVAARKSVEICESLVGRFPNNSENWNKLGQATRALIAIGQRDEALQVCHRQIDLCEQLGASAPPRLANAYLTLSFALLKTGAIVDSTKAWEKARANGPLDASLLNGLAWELAAPTVVEPDIAAWAVDIASVAAKSQPEDASLWNTLGVAQCRARRWQEAIASLERAEALAPDKHLAFDGFFLAIAHWHLGHKDDARAWYDRSVEWMEKNQPKNEELIRFRAEAQQLLSIAGSEAAKQSSSRVRAAQMNH